MRSRALVALGVLLCCCGGRPDPRPPRRGRQAPRLAGPPEWMRTAALVGTVQAEGAAVPGALVQLELLVGRKSLALGKVRSDSGGRFRFDRVVPGVGRLTVAAPGRASHQVSLWLEEGISRAPTLDLQRSAPISGRVADDRGRPVLATIRATSPAGWEASTRSDASGRFLLEGLGQGIYRLQAEAAEHVPTVEPEVLAPQSEIQLRLVRYYEIRGRVTGAARQATVRLAGSGIWPTRRVQSAADGQFRLPRVPGGVYELAAHTEGPPWAASEILAGLSVGPENPALVELKLRAVGRVHGVVVEEGDRPVPGAVLVLGQGPLSVLQHRVISDRDGRFAFPPVAGADLRLSVWARGFLPVLDQSIRAPNTKPLRINLSRGAALRGILSDGAGSPVRGALVWVTYRGRSGAAGTTPAGQLGVTVGPVPPIPAAGTPLPMAPPGPEPAEISPASATALSDASGGFALRGLEAGVLRVIAEHPDHARASSEWVEVRAGAEPPLIRITLPPAATVSGRILDDRGRPLPGAQLIARGGTSEPRFTESELDGAYRLRGLPGRVSLIASRAGYATATRVLSLEAGKSYEVDLVLELARGSIRGRVLDPSRIPVVGAQVSLRDHGGQQVGSTRSDAGGGFELRGVGSRPLALTVSHPSYLVAERVVRVGQEVEIQLGHPAALAGRVLDRRTGLPVTRFSLSVEGGRRLEVASAEGRFRLQGLAPGRVILRVDAPGYAVVSHPLRLPSPDRAGGGRPEWVEVSLLPAGTLEGQLTDRSGAPLTGATLSLGGVRVTTGAAGAFRLERVPEGSHIPEVRLADGRRLRADPVVVRGGDTQSSLRLIAR